jgi:hypothetical protein
MKIGLELENTVGILDPEEDRAMEYSINLVDVDRELKDGHYKAGVVYTFTMSSGLANTHGHVVLTDGGLEIIEQRGKDPQTAARIALERLLRQGRDPFESQIFLNVPFGHAEYFARYGSYETLPTLTE